MSQRSECLHLNVLNCVWSEVDTDLFGEKGHDGEDDERHQDTVRPELQLVPIHTPAERNKTFQFTVNEEYILYYLFCR